MSHLFSLIFLLVIPGICGQTWKVEYSNLNKCALKGSETFLSGSYTYPNNLNVTKTFWTRNPHYSKQTLDLYYDPHYKDRVMYYLGKYQTFSLKLSNVADEDEGMYCFRILTNVEHQRYLGMPGIKLKVTELRVEIPHEVIEGNSAVLFCKTTCSFTDRTKYTWFRNRKFFSESVRTNELLLQSVSSDDTGKYSCAVTHEQHLQSPTVTLTVRYPPKKTSVSISGSGEIILGNSVTLTCSCDSNPPAWIYTWFQENETSAVGSGQSFSALQSGFFYCVAQNEFGSQRSAAVPVTVTVTVEANSSTLIVVISAAVLASVILMVAIALFIRRKRKRVSPSEEQNNRGSQHNGEIESPEGAYMTLDPKSRCADYDTLQNMKRSCSNTDDPESQDPTYYNIDN
ncbi:B-cell receptor CD22-like isoform X2 [Myxocyprinus asiaticus]|uniref:B-cell receptor CD22-like isoform X2 n=1 Tax=Myxocyprinus asiaticus TaxID=70543 RepID=UPI0022219125|nr:B-cell receptor CD22-like isoform X2 [Myxocyprinus asiaticus]